MNTIINPSRDRWPSLTRRPVADPEALWSDVAVIMDDVRNEGDVAVRRWTLRFDAVDITASRVPDDVLQRSLSMLDADVITAMRTAAGNIRAFHQAQRRSIVEVETMPGLTCRMETRSIDAVGLYVPGGSAPLCSTVLMLAIPAVEAGCERIAICSPPDPSTGHPHVSIMAAAALCGIREVHAIGGVQAIAALTWGTESVMPVKKIMGPGNAWVTAAKQRASLYGVAIDLPAGPSEVLVLCDDTADADAVAADLLAQSEHGADSQVVLVTTSTALAERTYRALDEHLTVLPRKDIAGRALEHGLAIVFDDRDEAIAFTNAYAPEHLIVIMDDGDPDCLERICSRITAAGSVFLGPYTPESLGDYASGTNHTLPTGGWAGRVSGVTLDSFCVTMTVQRATKSALHAIASTVTTLARTERLEAHARSVTQRLTPILLNANENAFGSPFGDDLHRYPDPACTDLRQALGRYYDLPTDRIVCGNGSDELIDLAIRALCEPRRDVIVNTPPTFVMYDRCAAASKVDVRNVRRKDGFALDVDGVIEAVDDGVRMIVVCSPNNPTGNASPLAEIRRLLRETSAYVVVDHAYIEFAKDADCTSMVMSEDRLIVLRTLSKAWGLAGLRCGVLLAHPDVVRAIDAIRAPFNLSSMTQRMATDAIRRHVETMEENVRAIGEERRWLATQLMLIGSVIDVHPSSANFLFVRMRDADIAMASLERHGIVIRSRADDPDCVGHLRITVGTREQNIQVVDALRGGL